MTEELRLHDASEPRPLSGLGVIAWGLVCTAAWLIIILIAAEISSQFEDRPCITSETESLVTEISAQLEDSLCITSETGLLVFIAGQAIAGIVGWFLIPRIVLRRRNLNHLVSWSRPKFRDFAWAAAGLVAVYLSLFIYVAIVEAFGQDQLTPESTIDDDSLYQHTSVIIALGVLVILAAPIYEETFARGFVLGGLRPAWGILPSFLISAAVFSALHADLGSLIPFAIAGIILGILYLRTDSLTSPTIAHIGFNIIGYTATLLQQLA